MVKYYAWKDKGKRNQLEDEIGVYEDKDKKVFIVCDGVGGQENGEVASKVVVDSVIEYVKKLKFVHKDDLMNAVNYAKENLKKIVNENQYSEKMATTLVMCIIVNNHAHVLWAGDSRCYLIRKNEIVFVTEDHSLINYLVKSGELAKENFNNKKSSSNIKNVITKCISLKSDAEPDYQLLDIQAEDVILLCSDGVMEGISEESLLDFLNKTNDIKEVGKRIKGVCNLTSKDNFSFILIKNEKMRMCDKFLKLFKKSL